MNTLWKKLTRWLTWLVLLPIMPILGTVAGGTGGEPGAGDGQGQTPPDGTPPQGPGGGDKTFTQADVDRIINDRLARQKSQYADYEELKKSAGRLKDLETAQLSETEKRDKRIQELEAAAAEFEGKGRARDLEITERLVKAEVRIVASGMGFASPDDAYRLADLVEVKLDDQGAVLGVQKALDKLMKDKPYLAKGGGPGAGSPANNPKGKPTTEEQWVAEAQRRYGIKRVEQG